MWDFFFLLDEGEEGFLDTAEKNIGSEDAFSRETKGGDPTNERLDSGKASPAGSKLAFVVVSGQLYLKIPP